jgi:hypothetical protein
MAVVDWDELFFAFFSAPSLCFLFKELLGLPSLEICLVEGFSALGMTTGFAGRRGAFVISWSELEESSLSELSDESFSSESESSDSIEAGRRKPAGASVISASEPLSVLTASAEEELDSILPRFLIPKPIG